ncbi:MAG: phenylalanine--tRNA ligase subunit beta [Thermodesulfobacteriota bacterium]
MKLTVNWLREYVDCALEPKAIADRLTMLGLEVDAVEPLHAGLDRVVVARIEEVTPHPDADRLVLCQANIGTEVVPVVCGAPNARAGLLSALALPGAKLPGGEIRRSKIRGQVSAGMFCSGKDLGIGADNDGIVELPAGMTPGVDIRVALGLADTMIEIDLTPNRPDCASVVGIAREIAGATGGRLLRERLPAPPALAAHGLPFTVVVEDGDACPRYMARLIRDVRVGPSPAWLRNRLQAVGLRPISNVVDITNYVLLTLGQPLHAFDFDRLAGGIVVRRAHPGERITTLDGVARELTPEMLLICDQVQPMAVAGVMGGGASEVSDATVNVLLESAHFNPVSIRKTSRALRLSTDSSYRFERGVDPALPPVAMEMAVRLIHELCGGVVCSGGYDLGGDTIAPPPPIILRRRRVCDLLGVQLSAERIAELLNSIEITTTVDDAENMTVQPPSFRIDIEREVDCIEEIARLVGYDAIPVTLPRVPMSFAPVDAGRSLAAAVSGIMTANGFWEAVNYSFVSPAHCDILKLAAEDAARATLPLLNPIAENQAVMRSLLLPGLLENTARNINYQQYDVRLYETGKVFVNRGEELPEETRMLAAVLSGRRNPDTPLLYDQGEKVDFFDCKGVVDALVAELRLQEVTYGCDRPAAHADPDQFCRVLLDNVEVGCFGRLLPAVAQAYGIKQDLWFIEINLDALQAGRAATPIFRELPRFPSVSRDVALVIADEVRGDEVIRAVTEMRQKLVEDVQIFDVYRGKPVADGYKSLGIAIRYRSPEKTLDEATVDKVHDKIIQTVLSRFSGRLREE